MAFDKKELERQQKYGEDTKVKLRAVRHEVNDELKAFQESYLRALQEVTDELAAALTKAERARLAGTPRTPVRRLTRAEYEKFANETNRPTSSTCSAAPVMNSSTRSRFARAFSQASIFRVSESRRFWKT